MEIEIGYAGLNKLQQKRINTHTKVLALILVMFFFFISCEDDNFISNPPKNEGPIETSHIIIPEINLNGNPFFRVESACIGKSDSTSTYIYGIFEFEYLGDHDVSWLDIDAIYKDINNNTVFTDNSFVRNITPCYSGYSNYNINSFATPNLNKLYYIMIENLETYNVTINDISNIDLNITSSDFDYSEPIGILTRDENIIRNSSSQWLLNVENTGDTTLTTDFCIAIFTTQENKMFKWAIASSYIDEESSDIYKPGQKGYFKCYGNRINYLSDPLEIVEICLDWQPYQDSTLAKRSNLSNLSVDQINKILLNEMDRIERESSFDFR